MGYLDLLLTDVPSRIRWTCPICQDAGFVVNWRHSPWDLSGAIVDTETDEWIGEVEVVMTDTEYEAIQTLPLRDIASRRVIRGAVHTPDGILVGGPPADIDLLLIAIDVLQREERRADRKRILQQIARKLDDALLQSA